MIKSLSIFWIDTPILINPLKLYAMKKRYATGLNEVYDTTFVRLKNQSIILNNQNPVTNSLTVFWDKVSLEYHQSVLKGDDKDGMYTKRGERYLSNLADVKARIQRLKEQFEEYQQDRINEGYEKPEQMTQEMSEKMLMLEAEEDVYMLELEKIEDRLKSFNEAEQQENNKKILQHGLKEESQLRHGEIVAIDGQSVSNIDGQFIITEKTSPYRGMNVQDYRKLATRWREDKAKADEQELKKIQARAVAKGLPVPQGYVSFYTLGSFDELPPFPSEFKNYLKG